MVDDGLVLGNYEPDAYNAACNQSTLGDSGSQYDPHCDGEGLELEFVKIGGMRNPLMYWHTCDDQIQVRFGQRRTAI